MLPDDTAAITTGWSCLALPCVPFTFRYSSGFQARRPSVPALAFFSLDLHVFFATRPFSKSGMPVLMFSVFW